MIKEALKILKEHERTVYCLRVDSRTQYHDGDLEMPLVGLRGFFLICKDSLGVYINIFRYQEANIWNFTLVQKIRGNAY